MNKNWQKVYASESNMKAAIVEHLLQANGIQVVKLNKRDSAYGTFGEIELLVKDGDVIMAKHIIAKAKNE